MRSISNAWYDKMQHFLVHFANAFMSVFAKLDKSSYDFAGTGVSIRNALRCVHVFCN